MDPFNLNPIGLWLGRIEAPDSAFADQEEDIRGDTVILPTSNAFKFMHLCRNNGGPRRIRTPDPLIRSQVLYPAELSVRGEWRYAGRSGFARPKTPKNHARVTAFAM